MTTPLPFLAACDLERWSEALDPAEATRLANDTAEALLVAAVDGLDGFAGRYGEERTKEKRDRHCRLCRRHIEARGGQVLQREPDDLWFADAVLATFPGENGFRRAMATSLAIHRAVKDWNLEHWASEGMALWELHLHSRVAVATSPWLETLHLVQQAQRGEILAPLEDLDRLTQRELMFVRAAASVRAGVPKGSWEELGQEAADCFGLDVELSDQPESVARRAVP